MNKHLKEEAEIAKLITYWNKPQIQKITAYKLPQIIRGIADASINAEYKEASTTEIFSRDD